MPNHADLTATSLDVQIPIKGEVSLYMTDEYPHDLKFEEMKGESDLVVMVKVVRTMAPILEMVAWKFPDTQSECILPFLLI